jgi:hypothetical protein
VRYFLQNTWEDILLVTAYRRKWIGYLDRITCYRTPKLSYTYRLQEKEALVDQKKDYHNG